MNSSKSDKGKKKVKSEANGLNTDIRFLYMNVRNKSYIIRPSKKVYAQQTATSFNVGPGKYNPKVHQNSTSFEFSKVPRFGNDKLGLMLNRISSKSKIFIQNASEEKIPKKVKKISVRAKKLKADITKLTNYNIKSTEKELKEEKFKEKFKKVVYRRRICELAEIKKSWIAFFCTFGVVFSISSYISNRKRLRYRIFAQISRLRQVIMVVGKIRIKVKNIRKRKALKFLRIFFVPHLSKWLEKRKNRYKSLILTIFDKTLAASTLFAVSLKYYELLVRTQKSLKFILNIRRLFYSKLIGLWNLTELEFFSKKCLKKKKHTKTVGKQSKPAKQFMIPDEIKRFFLFKLMKQKYSGYLEQARLYSKSCKAVDELNKIREFEIKVMRHEKIQYPEKPKKVMLLKVIGKEDLKEAIIMAERSRGTWNDILNEINSKLMKSFKLHKD